MREPTSCFSALLITIVALTMIGCDKHEKSNAPSVPSTPTADLAAERSAFKTHLVRHSPSPEQEPLPDASYYEARDVTYSSGDLKLHAWLSKDPHDGKRHPAVVFLHGNFVFETRQWDATAPFRGAGMIVMTPMVRGENGNPGDFEMFYGEVDDVIAAGKYLASLPFVDPTKVYVTGHSVGGTLAILAAEMPSPFAAAAAYSGTPEMKMWMVDVNQSICPFDYSDASEMRLRSPMPFVSSLKCPLYLFDGTLEDWAIPKTKEFAAAAKAAGKQCEWRMVPGDHRSSKPIAISASIPMLLANQKGN